jgi:hypothetical protein
MEIWKKVESIGDYEISNFGKFRNAKTKFILKGNKLKNGYIQVDSWYKQSRKHHLLHRLIALSFIENPLNKPCVNHINGIKDDNRIENLEWVTQSENIIHSYKTGLSRNSEKQRAKASLNGRINGIKSCAKPILDIFNNVYYISLKDMETKLNINYSTIKIRIKKGIYKLI